MTHVKNIQTNPGCASSDGNQRKQNEQSAGNHQIELDSKIFNRRAAKE